MSPCAETIEHATPKRTRVAQGAGRKVRASTRECCASETYRRSRCGSYLAQPTNLPTAAHADPRCSKAPARLVSRDVPRGRGPGPRNSGGGEPFDTRART